MKKNPLVPILGGGVIAALVLGVMAVIVLVDAGLLHLLGVRCDSFGWLVLYVLVEAVLGLPLELFTAGLTKALVKLGWASPRRRFGGGAVVRPVLQAGETGGAAEENAAGGGA